MVNIDGFELVVAPEGFPEDDQLTLAGPAGDIELATNPQDDSRTSGLVEGVDDSVGSSDNIESVVEQQRASPIALDTTSELQDIDSASQPPVASTTRPVSVVTRQTNVQGLAALPQSSSEQNPAQSARIGSASIANAQVSANPNATLLAESVAGFGSPALGLDAGSVSAALTQYSNLGLPPAAIAAGHTPIQSQASLSPISVADASTTAFSMHGALVKDPLTRDAGGATTALQNQANINSQNPSSLLPRNPALGAGGSLKTSDNVGQGNAVALAPQLNDSVGVVSLSSEGVLAQSPPATSAPPIRPAALPPVAGPTDNRRSIEQTGTTYNTQDPAWKDLPYKFAGPMGQKGTVRDVGCTMTAVSNAINIATKGQTDITPADANSRNDPNNNGKFDAGLAKVKFTNLITGDTKGRGAPDPVGPSRTVKLADSQDTPNPAGQQLLKKVTDAVTGGDVVVLGMHHVDSRSRHTVVVSGYDRATNELTVLDNWQLGEKNISNGSTGARRMKLSDALALYGEKHLPTDPKDKRYRLADIDLAVVVKPKK
jgi:hypothetical protein